MIADLEISIEVYRKERWSPDSVGLVRKLKHKFRRYHDSAMEDGSLAVQSAHILAEVTQILYGRKRASAVKKALRRLLEEHGDEQQSEF